MLFNDGKKQTAFVVGIPFDQRLLAWAKEAPHAKVAEANNIIPLSLLLPCCQIRKPGYFEVLHAIAV